MPIVHKHCGGLVSQTTCKCSKCGKRWNLFNFWVNPYLFKKELEIVGTSRAEALKKVQERHKKSSYSSWGDRLPGVGQVASILPNWSRRTRILVVAMIVIVVVGLLITYI